VGVFHEKKFEEEVAELKADFDRLDLALSYVEYQLAEDPGSGIESSVPGIWVAPVRLPLDRGLVRFSIFYTYDGEDLTFQELKRAP
jgi:hypothetical protein